jgi:hypothetical protein
MMRRLVLASTIAAILAAGISGQPVVRFEVASVKPNTMHAPSQ